MGSVIASAPTVGSNHEIYDYKGVRFGLVDIGGQTSLRSSWNQYFASTSAIILVIDSSDAARLPLAKAELQKLVADEVGILGVLSLDSECLVSASEIHGDVLGGVRYAIYPKKGGSNDDAAGRVTRGLVS